MEGESVEQYITAFFTLRDTCEYGGSNLADKLLRDQLIVGICDTALAERLMLDAKLDLNKVMQIVRQRRLFMSTASSYKERETTPLLLTTWTRVRADITTGARLKGKKPKE